MECPKCGFETREQRDDCPSCGVIGAKFNPAIHSVEWKPRKRSSLGVLAALLTCAFGGTSFSAPVYKCTVDGVISYQNQPCKDAGERAAARLDDKPQLSIGNSVTAHPDHQTDFESEISKQAAAIDARKAAAKAEREEEGLIYSAIIEHKVRIGMKPEHVRQSWGQPMRINASAVKGVGRTEQWVYDRGPNSQYIYFENSRVVSWN